MATTSDPHWQHARRHVDAARPIRESARAHVATCVAWCKQRGAAASAKCVCGCAMHERWCLPRRWRDGTLPRRRHAALLNTPGPERVYKTGSPNGNPHERARQLCDEPKHCQHGHHNDDALPSMLLSRPPSRRREVEAPQCAGHVFPGLRPVSFRAKPQSCLRERTRTHSDAHTLSH